VSNREGHGSLLDHLRQHGARLRAATLAWSEHLPDYCEHPETVSALGSLRLISFDRDGRPAVRRPVVAFLFSALLETFGEKPLTGPATAGTVREGPVGGYRLEQRPKERDNMRLLTVVGVIVLVVLAATACTALAAEPTVLVLPGETIQSTEIAGISGEVVIEVGGGKNIKCVKSKNADTLEGAGADTSKGRATIDFEGCKEGSTKCRSESETGEKDPLEIILWRTATLSAALEQGGKLFSGIVFTLLPEPKGGNQVFNCATLKNEVKGSFGCVVSPGLTEIAAGGTITITCLQIAGKQTNLGTCVGNKATCEELTAHPLEGAFGGKGIFEKAGVSFVATDKATKMLFFDD
jgi:hypothetical protein